MSNMVNHIYKVRLVFTDYERTVEALKQRWPLYQLRDRECIVIAHSIEEIFDVCKLRPDYETDIDNKPQYLVTVLIKDPLTGATVLLYNHPYFVIFITNDRSYF